MNELNNADIITALKVLDTLKEDIKTTPARYAGTIYENSERNYKTRLIDSINELSILLSYEL